MSDGRVLTNVEVIKIEAGSVWIWSGKTLASVKVGDIKVSRLAEDGAKVSQSELVPSVPEKAESVPPNVPAAVQKVDPAPGPEPSKPVDVPSEKSSPLPVLAGVLALAAAVLVFLLRRSLIQRSSLQAKVSEYEKRYRPLVDFDAALRERAVDLEKIGREFDERKNELTQLNVEVAKQRKLFQLFETEAEFVACGHYKPQFDFGTSEEYKSAITGIREKQRQMIKDDSAAVCGQTWKVNGSEAEGKKATKRTLRLMLRAFNGECDAIIANLSWSNVDRMSERLEKCFEAINKLGESYQCVITLPYYRLRKQELDLAYGFAARLQKEKEEQRALREQMREEEKARREMEAAIRQAALDEERAQAALEKARAEVARTTGEKESVLNDKIRQLEQRLAEAHTNKERAISRAEQTRSGHVYVISNIGSFGEAVFKIGMTRRLDPFERVDELGDASVPFEFDVHGMIYTEDAPTLESKLHSRFVTKRVNLVNDRKEFFQVSIEEIQTAVHELGASIILTKLAEAREYRETLERRRAAGLTEVVERAS